MNSSDWPKPSGSFDSQYCYMPYKKGEALQHWYCFDTKKQCAEWLAKNTEAACWKGFKPQKYHFRKTK